MTRVERRNCRTDIERVPAVHSGLAETEDSMPTPEVPRDPEGVPQAGRPSAAGGPAGAVGGMFARLFGAGGGRAAAAGSDLTVPLDVSFEDAARGARLPVHLDDGRRTLEVTVPAGIEDGAHIRIAGAAGIRSSGGDLYLAIRVPPHSGFDCHGDDLHVSLPVSAEQLSGGGPLDVPAIDGTLRIELPAGTADGTEFRLRGQGVKGSRSDQPGDLHVHISLQTERHGKA
jgi:DnaJ-class molecular chaperone